MIHLQYTRVGSTGIIVVLSVIHIVVLQLRRWLGPFIVVAPISDAMWLGF